MLVSMEKKSEVLSIASGIMFVISFIADASGILSQFELVFQIVMLITAIIMVACAIYFWKKENKYRELESENNHLNTKIDELNEQLEETKEMVSQLVEEREELKQKSRLEKEKTEKLELQVCNGKKYISNKATIVFDYVEKKYKLSFEKRYIIISNAIKWYEGQFYSNKYLESAEVSQSYYNDNPVRWDELNIRAELKYKNKEDNKFSKTKEVAVLQIAEGNNYKKFHIQYITCRGGDKLPIKKGAEIILNYSYEVPVILWGSYLNRYISYWKETTEVILKCKSKDRLKEDSIKVYQTEHITGEPFITDINIETDIHNGETSFVIKLPNEDSCKYVIWWNAEDIFGLDNLNTNMTMDHSQQTQY